MGKKVHPPPKTSSVRAHRAAGRGFDLCFLCMCGFGTVVTMTVLQLSTGNLTS